MKPSKRPPYEAALREMRRPRPNIKVVLSLLTDGRREGDGRAAYALGTWYAHGRHVPKSLFKAARLFREAAKTGVPEAFFDLAVCFETGEGAKRNLERAYRLYLEAALKGDADSFNEVFRCLYYGIGVARDTRSAWIWHDHAAQVNVAGRGAGASDRSRGAWQKM